LAKLVAGTDEDLRRTQHPRLLLELLLVRLCSVQRVVSLEALWRQLKNLEQRVTALPEKAELGAPAAALTETAVTEKPAGESVPVAPALPLASEDQGAALNLILEEGGEAPDMPAGEPLLAADSLEEAAPATPLDRVKTLWAVLVQNMGQQNRRVQALLKDVTLSAAEPGWVEITCMSPYHLTGLEKEESRKVVEAALEAALGRPTRMRLKVTGGAEKAPAPEDGVRDREKEFEEITRKEPMVQKALELFGGKIVDVVSKPGQNKK
jgi:hypothetical protein